MSEHLERDLRMISFALDPAYYTHRNIKGELDGIMGVYVDDAIIAGENPFLSHTDQSLKNVQVQAT